MDAEQQLFLMEFLVEKVNIPTTNALQNEHLPATTCVSFQILNLPPVVISQESEDCVCPESKSSSLMRKGKSCLFALPSSILEKPVNTFPITLSVYKKLPPDVLPDVMFIGNHQIEGRDFLNDMINRRPSQTDNPSKKIRDTYRITTVTGQVVGEVTVFIRFGCFGKKIVTQFQMPRNKKPYIFKSADDGQIFQCKKGSIPLSEYSSPFTVGAHGNTQPLAKQSLFSAQGISFPVTGFSAKQESIEPTVRPCGCRAKGSELYQEI